MLYKMAQLLEYFILVIPYISLVSFISGILTEELLVVLGILAGNGVFPLWKVCLFGFLGVIVHDICMYFLAQTRLVYAVKRKWKLTQKHQDLSNFIEQLGGRTYFFPSFFLNSFMGRGLL